MKQNPQNFSANCSFNKTSGFTLIELMIVVAIIGILASIALPHFQVFVAKSKRAEGIMILKAFHKTEFSYYASEDVFLVTNSVAPPPAALGFALASPAKFYDMNKMELKNDNATPKSADIKYTSKLPTFSGGGGLDSDSFGDALCMFYPIHWGGFGVCCNHPSESGQIQIWFDDIKDIPLACL